MNMTIERKKVSPRKVQRNDLMAFVYYGKVASTYDQGKRLDITNVDNKQLFQVNGKTLVEDSFSADRFASEEKVTKTKAAEILTHSYNLPFSVAFNKTDGSERVLRGRLVEPEPLLGRSLVEDLDNTTGSPLRQVDHRTIKFLIVNGVKYTVK